MVNLSREYGLSPVAQALRVNYTALKHHLAATAVAQTARSGASAAHFVEVPMRAGPGGSQLIIELEDRAGSKLTLRLAQTEISGALALAQGLWRQRS